MTPDESSLLGVSQRMILASPWNRLWPEFHDRTKNLLHSFSRFTGDNRSLTSTVNLKECFLGVSSSKVWWELQWKVTFKKEEKVHEENDYLPDFLQSKNKNKFTGYKTRDGWIPGSLANVTSGCWLLTHGRKGTNRQKIVSVNQQQFLVSYGSRLYSSRLQRFLHSCSQQPLTVVS